jgi:transposase-like zinc ribbon protein
MDRAVFRVMLTLTRTPTPVCPHCASHALTFLEHGSGVTVFRCEACTRATVQQWTPPAAKAPPNQDFVFPSWFTGIDRR